MDIIKLFRKEMNNKPDQEAERLEQSLQRRDRRIDYLKRKLRKNRDESSKELQKMRGLIDGLEQALLMHAPVFETQQEARIAELQSQLAAMTDLAHTLQDQVSL